MPLTQRRRDGHQSLRAIETDDVGAKLIAVVVDMIHVKTGSDAKRRRRLQILRADQRAVFEPPPVIGAFVRAEDFPPRMLRE